MSSGLIVAFIKWYFKVCNTSDMVTLICDDKPYFLSLNYPIFTVPLPITTPPQSMRSPDLAAA
ncbi:hypothetical protein CQP30_00110 [Yersinia pestis]|uniref:Uncharacterized protein n=3 Tax=Yersinia pseudotuberculosis complex TaxID=1649845 RepID=A0A3G5L8E4_YERPE|nr:hypothetical [Yersinia pestis KIM10+]AYW87642.1 hypothetical protein EGX87_10905 [Yersinia pseudotuberculosis]AYX20294.1 hypothetical protein EGX46_13435 [Yersinia pestis]OSZ89371.1 hypothetical protein A7720_11865 [Yersinia pestis subsp. microtus bv. Caucasica]OVY54114.1 hypothetical protein BFI45_17680 [Yersinia pestis subsp. microtus bv. Altaica]OVY78980.1 hypothetical protein BFI50_00120 [Yersinia pestis subsp. microtus bv. Xilingolensis]OVY86641.1 hypothetical protein BFI52_04660 [Yer